MTDAEFLDFCQEHEDLQVESNARGEIEIMPGTVPETGNRNSEINHQLRSWAKQDGRGRCFDSSTMFRLPSGARRSPDASWMDQSKVAAHDKMLEWLSGGVQLGWLIDPEERSVTVYRPGEEPRSIIEVERLAGDGPVTGFVLDLGPVFEEILRSRLTRPRIARTGCVRVPCPWSP